MHRGRARSRRDDLKARALARLGSIDRALSARNAVALTFDDGPHPDVTPCLLDLLKRRQACATFFLLSERASARPDLVRRMISDGHEVGLHFDRHDRIPDLAPSVAWRRLRRARAIISSIAGPIRLYRPPYGSQNVASYLVARSLGLTVVGWSASAHDWEPQTAVMAAARATDTIEPGHILLMHDGLELGQDEAEPNFDRVEMVDLILDRLAERNLTPTTVGALVADGGAHMTAWFRP